MESLMTARDAIYSAVAKKLISEGMTLPEYGLIMKIIDDTDAFCNTYEIMKAIDTLNKDTGIKELQIFAGAYGICETCLVAAMMNATDHAEFRMLILESLTCA